MIRLLELFSGYGGASWGLKKAGIEFECIGHSEIEPSAIKCYEQNFPGVKNYGDIKDIKPEELPDFDLLCGGFPCQDVSLAGLRDLSKGRTSLVSYIFRIAEVKKPKYMVLENVKGILSSPHFFDSIRHTLNKIGYGCVYATLNSTAFGVPQNRERVWIVCKYGGWEFMEFMFPNGRSTGISVWNLLEQTPDEKYYLTKERLDKMVAKGFNPEIIAQAPDKFVFALRAYPRTDDPEEDKRYGRFQKIEIIDGGITNTLTSFQKDNMVAESKERIRVLTPKECFRLMGFFDDEIKLDGLTNKQLWELSGNGWDVIVAKHIFKNLYKSMNNTQYKV